MLRLIISCVLFFGFFFKPIQSTSAYEWFVPCLENGYIFFKSSFESDEKIIEYENGKFGKIESADYGSCSNVNDATKMTFGKVNFQMDGGSSDQRLINIIIDPINNKNNVLQFVINEPNVLGKKGYPIKAREQMNVYGGKNIHHIVMKVKMFVPYELKVLEDYPGQINWLTISEWWNNASWVDDKFPFRITVGFFKNKSSNKSPILFKVHAQSFNLKTKKWDSEIWSAVNSEVKLPFGQWVTLSYDIFEGDRENGHFLLKMKQDNGKEVLLFNVNDFTFHPEETNPQGFSHINPIKLYTSVQIVNYLKQKGVSLKILWDDLEIIGFSKHGE